MSEGLIYLASQIVAFMLLSAGIGFAIGWFIKGKGGSMKPDVAIAHLRRSEQEKSELQTEIEALQRQIASGGHLPAGDADLENELAIARREISQLRLERDQRAEVGGGAEHPEFDALAQRYDQLDTEKSRILQELTALRVRLDELPRLEAENHDLKSRLAAAANAMSEDQSAELVRLQSELNATRVAASEAVQLKRRVEELEAGQGSTAIPTDELTARLTRERDQAVADLRNSSAAAAEELRRLKDERDQFATAMKNIQQDGIDAAALRQERDRLKADLENIRAGIGVNADWESEKAALQLQLNKQSEEIGSLRLEVIHLQEGPSNLEQERDTLTAKLADLEAAFAVERQGLQAKVDQAQSMALESGTIVANLETEIEELRREGSAPPDWETEKKELTARAEALEAMLGDLTQQRDMLIVEGDRLRHEIATQTAPVMPSEVVSAEVVTRPSPDAEADAPKKPRIWDDIPETEPEVTAPVVAEGPISPAETFAPNRSIWDEEAVVPPVTETGPVEAGEAAPGTPAMSIWDDPIAPSAEAVEEPTQTKPSIWDDEPKTPPAAPISADQTVNIWDEPVAPIEEAHAPEGELLWHEEPQAAPTDEPSKSIWEDVEEPSVEDDPFTKFAESTPTEPEPIELPKQTVFVETGFTPPPRIIPKPVEFDEPKEVPTPEPEVEVVLPPVIETPVETAPATTTKIPDIFRKAVEEAPVVEVPAAFASEPEKAPEPTPEPVKEEAPSDDFKAYKPGAKDEPDDLEEIIGVGPVAKKVLVELGYNTFKKVSEIEFHDMKKISAVLDNARNRIEKEKWREQARVLHRAKYGG